MDANPMTSPLFEDRDIANSVWLCDLLRNDAAHFPFDWAPNFVDGEKMLSVSRRNERGEALTSNFFPKEIYAKDDQNYDTKLRYDKMQNLVWAGITLVSAKAADIIRNFDLGQGALYPIKVLEKDRQTRLGREYFAWNFGNVKKCLVPEKSPKLHRNRYSEIPQYRPPWPCESGDVVVSSSALLGPDVWAEPIISDTFFVHGKLAEALMKAGMSEDFQFKRCAILV